MPHLGRITDLLRRVAALETGGSSADVSSVHHVRAAATGDVANLAACSTTMDTSVTLVEGDRVLLPNQAAAAQNGIYVVGAVSGGAAPLTRALDWDGTTEVKPNTLVVCAEGTTYLGSVFELTADFPVVIGTSHQHFTRILNATELTALMALATTAAGIGIADAGTHFPTDNVEAALQYTMDKLKTDDATSLSLLIKVRDVLSIFTADTLAGQLQEVKAEADAFTSIQSRTLRVVTGDLTDAVNGHTQVFNIGSALPTGAIVVGAELNIVALFAGGAVSAVTVDVGGTDADAIGDGHDVFTGATTGRLALTPAGVHRAGNFSAQQLTISFTPDAGHPLVDTTAGDLTVTVWFFIPTALQTASLTVAHGNLTALAHSESIPFAAALPAGAIILGHEINVTALFTDGAACTSDVDLGISAGDTDRIENGLDTTLATGALGRQYGIAGVQPQGLYDAATLAVTVNASVNVDTLTAGSITATVWYMVP